MKTKELMLEKAIRIGIAKGYRIDYPDDWYGGIKGFINYNNVVRSLFPNYTFYEWKFNRVTPSWWRSTDNKITYLKWLEKELGWSEPKDWYKLNRNILENNYGSSLRMCVKGGQVNIPNVLYPEYNFLPWCYFKVLESWWCSTDNQITYLKWLEKELGWSEPSDWYKLTKKNIIDNYGNSMCIKFNVSDIPKILYPDYDFLVWKFNHVKKNWWKNNNNILKYLKWLEIIMNWSKPEDLYKITADTISDNYGSSLNKLHNLLTLCKIRYPEYDFLEWRFERNNNFWFDKNNQIKYLKWLENKLSITHIDEWYNVSKKDFIDNNCAYFSYIPLLDIVKIIYPNYNWDKTRLLKTSKTQARIFKFIQKLYPNNIVLNDDRKTIRNPNTNCYLELDIYLPELKLAIEYDGETHYNSITWFGGDEALERSKIRDSIKDDICKELNIRLIRVPYFENDIEQFLLSRLPT